MENNKLPKACYSMLYRQEELGRVNWASHIKAKLFSLGFGMVWILQDVGNVVVFLSEVKQRLIDIAAQEWNSDLHESSKLKTLREFKSLLEPELYLECIKITIFRTALAKLRCSAHRLEIEIGRHTNIDPEQRVCRFCVRMGEYMVEDEYHFLMLCPLYISLREKYLPNWAMQNPTSENFVSLLKQQNVCNIRKLAAFVFYAFQSREEFMNTV